MRFNQLSIPSPIDAANPALPHPVPLVEPVGLYRTSTPKRRAALTQLQSSGVGYPNY
ncbi:MAG TPA: hypothetical protein V6D06_18035 [Trichocoleus sp.]